MDVLEKGFVTKRVVVYEAIAFVFLVIFIWLDEVIDIPHLLLGAQSTPLNWKEALFESLTIAFVGVLIVNVTNKLFQRMIYLEGTLSICANCKRIRDDKGNWRQIESYIQDHSDARFSHGICEECSDKLYGDKTWYQEMKKKQENEI